jgi:hypothetical protein
MRTFASLTPASRFDPRQKSRAFAEQQALEDRHAVRVREYGVEGD